MPPSKRACVCTCPAPHNVNLSNAYRAKYAASSWSNETENPPNIFNCLLQNLQDFGWSPLSLNLSEIRENSPLRQGSCRDFWKDPKETITKLFDPEFVAKQPFANATYRTAESGSAGEAAVEPKQSWETRRCHYYDEDDNTKSNCDNTLLNDIAAALHSVITTVNDLLKLPPNLLVQQNQNDQHHHCSCRRRQKEGPCNVDLLRVFFYDKVDANVPDTWGSSPHTDWGSWTVVWQDHVGGLQTYCQACRSWKSVKAPDKKQDSTLHFVIHVGDATSLALAKVMSLKVDSSQRTTQQQCLFPSPLHRVLSPITEPRASLVYFVYPPPGQSLELISNGLAPWYQSQKPVLTKCMANIPYHHYYLLHDQSATTITNDASSDNQQSRTVFDRIYQKPLDQVFSEKWRQVQRSDD